MHAVEKGIPVPEPKRGRPVKYPWRTMEVGDSFFVTGVTAKYLSGSRGNWQRVTGHTFIIRTQRDGARVWRTA